MDLLEVMAALRAPGGCSWDQAQTHRSLRRYAVEEVYEVLEAIDQEDDQALIDELGDLLFQVVFHAQIAAEEGRFDFHDVWQHAAEKMIRRHPHVFGLSDKGVSWESIKQQEGAAPKGYFSEPPKGMPALMELEKTLHKARKAGYPVEQYPALEETLRCFYNGKTETLTDVIWALLAHRDMVDDAENMIKQRLRDFRAYYRSLENGDPFFFEQLSENEKEILWKDGWNS